MGNNVFHPRQKKVFLCFRLFASVSNKLDLHQNEHVSRRGSRILKWGVNFSNNVIEPKPG